MKKIVLISIVFLFAYPSAINAQISQKMVDRTCKNTAKIKAKKLQRHGFQLIGGGSMYLQAYDQCVKQYQKDHNGENMYIIGTGLAIGSSYYAAEQAARKSAEDEISETLKNNISNLVKEAVQGTTYSPSDVKEATKLLINSASNSEGTFTQVAPVRTLFEVHRLNKKAGNYEVRITLAINWEDTFKATEDLALQKLMGSNDNSKVQNIIHSLKP